MDSVFKIFVDRLKDGKVEKISTQLNPEFLSVNEKDLSFREPIAFSAEAYLAIDHLIFQFSALTQVSLPCAICNEMIPLPLEVKNTYHSFPLAELPTAIFDSTDLVRETILLQIPQFAECKNGKCPERESIKKFLKSSPSTAHFPFAEL